MSDVTLPLLKATAADVHAKVLVCGDPARAEQVAKRLDNPREISYNREYRLFDGMIEGEKVSVCSHGVGGSGAAVCFEELIRGGAREVIRIGTAGSLAPDQVRDGDIVVSTGAVRMDGVTQQLVATEYPAVAELGLTNDLLAAAGRHEVNAAAGIVLTVSAFYPGVEPNPNAYYAKANAVAVEMEAATLFVIASLHGIAAGGVFAIDGVAVDFDAEAYDPHREVVKQGVENSISIAVDAVSAGTGAVTGAATRKAGGDYSDWDGT